MPLPELEAQAEEAKRRALEALAQYGTAGQAAYDQAQAGITASQNEALEYLAGLAGGMNVVPAGVAELAAIARRPGDVYQQALTAGEATFQQDLARQQASMGGYFDQLSASLPALEQWMARGGGGGGGGGGVAEPEDPFNRYGGYGTEGEYENAVTALARQAWESAQAGAEQQRAKSAQNAYVQQRGPVVTGRQGRALGYAYGGHGVSYNPRATPVAQRPRGVQSAGDVQARLQAQRRGMPTETVTPGLAGYPGSESWPGWTGPPGEDRPLARRVPARGGVPTAQVHRRPIVAAAAGQDRYLRDLVRSDEEYLGQVAAPDALAEFAREVAINQMGADPAEALGRFTPEWALGVASAPYEAESDYTEAVREWEERQQYGGMTLAEITAQMDAERGLIPGTTRQRMQTAGVDSPDELVAIESSDEYVEAAAQVEAAVASWLAGTDPEAPPVDINYVRWLLLQQGVPESVARLILADYAGRLPGSSFLPPTV